jgi:signal transduction histidine kinase
MSKRWEDTARSTAAVAAPAPRNYWEKLEHAWRGPQDSKLREAVRKHFQGRQSVDRESYRSEVGRCLSAVVQEVFFAEEDDSFDLYGFEYGSLYSRIMGESAVPESMVFLCSNASRVTAPRHASIQNAMKDAYGQELTYLSLIPRDLKWLQVVLSRGPISQPVECSCTVSVELPEEAIPANSEIKARWSTGDFNNTEKENIRKALHARAKKQLKGVDIPWSTLKQPMSDVRSQLAEMIGSTPFMTLTRMAQTDDKLRSILYFPAYLHDDRIGGGVLMGTRALSDEDLIEVLCLAAQMLLAQIRLAEFPEETGRAEKEVFQRQMIRRFRHNIMHPLGNLMDATARFKDAFDQILVVFERGVESWRPDLLPNYVVRFLKYVAEEFQSQGDAPSESPEEDRTVRFPIEVKGDERMVERFDRSIIGEVMRNLFTNTGRYAAGNGLTGVVVTAESDGTIEYKELGGPGLPPAIASDPWRLHPRDPGLEASTGQGLFMSKRLMEVHGGDIQYDPTHKPGCMFKIYLRKKDEHDGKSLEDGGNR